MRYDSLGRMVLNVEPNTSESFNADPSTPPGNVKAWRYAYSDAGDLVGTSDARGCGANYHYDAGGRLVAEDRSPCLEHHPEYSPPNLATGAGTELFFRYDTADPAVGSIVDDASNAFSVDTRFYLGHVTAVYGQGSRSIPRYDALGRGTGVAVQVAKPGPADPDLEERYAPRWYVRTQTFDVLDRVTTATTGVTTQELLGTNDTSELVYGYSKRGALVSIGGSYGTLLASKKYAADGLPKEIQLGDGAATRRDFQYDARRRVETVMTYRAAAPHWSSPPHGLHPARLGRLHRPALARRRPAFVRHRRQHPKDRRQPHRAGMARLGQTGDASARVRRPLPAHAGHLHLSRHLRPVDLPLRRGERRHRARAPAEPARRLRRPGTGAKVRV